MTAHTIDGLITAYKTGSTTPRTVVEACLDTIRAKNPDLHAFLSVYEEHALAAADAATARYAAGEETPPMLGVPYALKNNILYEGQPATAGSRMLETYTATYDATVVARLREAGAICLGATNMDEFAMGSSTENSAFGPTKNPRALDRVPGGSSGGSAAAVAMEAAPFALGTDTGGSIRQPASYCGVVGFKPTYGAVSRYGLVAMGSSLDQAGPLTHTVADAERVHAAIQGVDSYDATSITDDTYPEVAVQETYTVGVPYHLLSEGVDPEIKAGLEAHLRDIEHAGHTVKEIELPLFTEGLAAYYIVMPAEVSSNLARYDGIRYGLSIPGDTLLEGYQRTRAEGFGPEVKRRILLGTYVLSSGYYDAYYGKAEQVRTLMREELSERFSSVDLIVTPTAPTPAFRAGEKTDPLAMYAQDVFTVPVNLTGVPALSVPGGVVSVAEQELPYGVQYIAPHGGDARLFDFGKQMYDQRRTNT
jgi:aspartyl-tRNA(Asn)/glutamyl-tRNA(Gln) amidotransferase subunit A